MKIVFVTPEYITENDFDGGLANYLYRVTQALLQCGHELVVVVASKKNEVLNHDGITVVRVEIHEEWKERFWLLRPEWLKQLLHWLYKSWKMNRAVREINRATPVSIVQHASFQMTGIFRPKQIPCVVRISSYQPLWVKNYGYQCGWAESKATKLLEDMNIKLADGVLCPSRLLCGIVEQETGRRVAPIEPPFLPSSVELDESVFSADMKGKKYLLFFGTLSVLKGVAVIAEILLPLLEKHPELYFVFIGKDAGYKGRPMIDHLRERAGKHETRVIPFNKLRHPQLIPFIRNSWAVVLPSRIDNFPNTCLEAMAEGKVVVGTRGASFDQILIDGETGFLCEPDDPLGLLSVIEKVLSMNSSELARIGTNAINSIVALSPEISTCKLLSFYEQVINHKMKLQ